MSRPISRRAHLELYSTSDSETQTIYLKLLNNDIVNCFAYLQTRMLMTSTAQGEPYFDITQGVLERKDFTEMLDLYRAMSKTAHAINALEKHFTKLTSTAGAANCAGNSQIFN